MIKGLEYLSYE